MIVNTAGVLLFMSAKPQEWYESDGLVSEVFTMLLINAIIPPLIPYFDFGFRVRAIKRGKLTQEKMDQYTEVVKRCAGQVPEPAELKQVRQEIERWKAAFAPSQMNCSRRYATALKTFVCCLLYMPVLPILSLLGFVGLMLQYYMDKYLLLRWHKRPDKPANAFMANFSLRFIKYTAPIALSVAFFSFLTPSYHVDSKGLVLSNFFMSLFISIGFSFAFPLSIWMKLFLGCCTPNLSSSTHEEDYYNAQFMWSKEMKYHKDQFIYKSLPEKVNPEYLQQGVTTVAAVEDMKSSYGVGVAQVAAAAASGSTRVALKGGKTVGSLDDVTTDPGAGGTAPGPAPATIGAATPGATSVGSYTPGGAIGSTAPPSSSDVAYTPGTPAASTGFTPGAATTDSPTAPLVASGSYVPGAAATDPYVPGATTVDSPLRPGRVTWQFSLDSGGWTAFNVDCQEYIEAKYQEFASGGGRDQINVRTGGIQISVNFSKMSQKKEGSHKIRKIQRKESE
eukprot:TRINITY_DN12847_c5_g1_i1.p1 TRINITY_DN12847_c5_g1~~TRINITY_DN12847_c5_g1_i1.p1  ORF type:complete len:506 (-),score=82.36 TRINITY_DN12847_c5_g1_i1:246-1763(-)